MRHRGNKICPDESGGRTARERTTLDNTVGRQKHKKK